MFLPAVLARVVFRALIREPAHECTDLLRPRPLLLTTICALQWIEARRVRRHSHLALQLHLALQCARATMRKSPTGVDACRAIVDSHRATVDAFESKVRT
jgi:hypothetical protein